MPLYQPADKSLWTGRAVSADLSPQYWHQVIEFTDLRESSQDIGGCTVLLGYAVDEGVRRNQGRVGAAEGPDVARGYLGRLANHLNGRRIVDAGNIVCSGRDLESAQEELSRRVAQICRAGGRPTVIGGGHDIAYGHFRGLHRAHHAPGKCFGIINFDAHLDLRTPADGPTSGTPFHQILTEFGDATRYLAVGIQAAANPPALFAAATGFGVTIIEEADCISRPDRVRKRLAAFAGEVDHLYVTVDMDGFFGSTAPGVSAPNPSGLSPAFVLKAVAQLVTTGKVAGADVAEFNPIHDVNDLTGRLVSRVVYELA